MSIVGDNYEDLFGLAKHHARKYLGGAAGNDYASWEEDIAQDVIVSLLEREAEGTLREDEMFGLCKVMAFRKAAGHTVQEERRREIEQENGETINRNLTGQSAELLAADPYEILAFEEARDRLDSLSPLLYSTVEAVYMEGRSVTELAEEWGVTEDTLYKRIQRAKEIITGE